METTMGYKRTPEQRQKIDELIWALRSGKYKRTTGTLRSAIDLYHPFNNDNQGMCCLGVACDLNLETVGIKWRDRGSIVKVDGSDISTADGELAERVNGYAPREVADLYGFEWTDQSLLASANDGGAGMDVDPWDVGGAVIVLLQDLRDEVTG